MANTVQTVRTISEINRLARLALESQLQICWVKGEISNLTRASSGHWYFTLKDANASARCVMFRTRNQFVDWPLRDGEKVEVRAQATLYEPRGDFQLNIEAMRKAGQGDLYEAFLRLKEKLQQEGLFDLAHKRAIPFMPRTVGVITSPGAAALRDVLTTLRRRWPQSSVILYPCQVQGEPAPRQIQEALRVANQRNETEVLLLIRGGGSLEDLQAFNDEGVARSIAASNIPVVSGIGHETDFSIADFVADLRAPTPTGAAELVTPDAQEFLQRLQEINRRLSQRSNDHLQTAWQKHDHLIRRVRHPREQLQSRRSDCHHLLQRLIRARQHHLAVMSTHLRYLTTRLFAASPASQSRLQHVQQLRGRLHHYEVQSLGQYALQLAKLSTQLRLLCPAHILERGYSIVRNHSGALITSASSTVIGDNLNIELAQGKLSVTVKDRTD